jgi:hypothetical protein
MTTKIEIDGLRETFGGRLIALRGGQVGLRATLCVAATPDAADPDVLTMRASDETLDRYEEVISAAGWKLENYAKTPVIQNAHNYGSIIDTIGRAEKTWVEDGALMQRWRFASAANPIARVARDLYAGGFLTASSVGFIPITWENGGKDSGFYRKYLTQELLEVSAVAIPANPSAIVDSLREGAIQSADLQDCIAFLKNILDVQKASLQPAASATGSGADVAQCIVCARDLVREIQAAVKALKRRA